MRHGLPIFSLYKTPLLGNSRAKEKMAKVLIFATHSRATYKIAQLIELFKMHIDRGDEIRILDCDGVLGGYCSLNRGAGRLYCNKCTQSCDKAMALAGITPDKLIPIKKFAPPEFAFPSSLQELKDYHICGVEVGVGIASVVMTLGRDFMPDIAKYKKCINGYFRTAYTMIKNVEAVYGEWKFDEFETFNGRLPSVYPVLNFCRNKGIDFYLYEGGANRNKLRCLKNELMHELDPLKNEITRYWAEGKEPERTRLAQKWFDDRRGAKYQAQSSFTAEQKKDSLPADWDASKENIAVFNSSIDEIYAFDCWKNPFEDNENDLLVRIFEHYKNDTSKHFYLRVHPNLAKAKQYNTLQILQINALKRKYKNLTVIEPEEKIDSYALVNAASKILTFTSTIGFEATYEGKVSILAGRAPYEDLDCTHRAKSVEDIFALIDDKALQPKPKGNTYPYAYRNEVYGLDFKYVKAKSEEEAYLDSLPLALSGGRLTGFLKRLIKGRHHNA